MNPATVAAAVLVDELVRCGVREAVLAPGSRNAPLAFALYDADAAGRLRLHVRIDERSAAFLALGLAKASDAPVVVTCTSGTAAANLHPAVLEADASGIPLVALTADRPPEMRGVGANQTADQVKLYGDAVRLFVDAAVPGTVAEEEVYWRTLVDRAIAAARATLGGEPGPVHLNLPVREPLVPDADTVDVGGRPDGRPWTQVVAHPVSVDPVPVPGGRALVIAGDGAPAFTGDVPVIAEPSSNARHGPACLTTGTLLLGVPGLLDRMTPQHVHVLGRPTLSRAVQRLLGDDRVAVHVHPRSPRWPDVGRHAVSVGGATATVASDGRDWVQWWQAADLAARAAVDSWLAASSELSGPAVARGMADFLSDEALLFVGSSQPIRDLDLAAGPIRARVLANRGVAGIDGTVSAAMGAALAHAGPSYALVGDL